MVDLFEVYFTLFRWQVQRRWWICLVFIYLVQVRLQAGRWQFSCDLSRSQTLYGFRVFPPAMRTLGFVYIDTLAYAKFTVCLH